MPVIRYTLVALAEQGLREGTAELGELYCSPRLVWASERDSRTRLSVSCALPLARLRALTWSTVFLDAFSFSLSLPPELSTLCHSSLTAHCWRFIVCLSQRRPSAPAIGQGCIVDDVDKIIEMNQNGEAKQECQVTAIRVAFLKARFTTQVRLAISQQSWSEISLTSRTTAWLEVPPRFYKEQSSF